MKGAELQFACYADLLVQQSLPRGRVRIAAAGWHVWDHVEPHVRWRGIRETIPFLADFEPPAKCDNLADMFLQRVGHCPGKIRWLGGEEEPSAQYEGKESDFCFHAPPNGPRLSGAARAAKL